MATITTLAGGKTSGRTAGSVPYFVDATIDFAAAATAKGSALAAADVIQCINVPANTIVLCAGTEIITAPAGGTSCTFDLGITGGDVDAFVDGGAITSATAGTYATMASTAAPIAFASADTIDMLLIGTTPDTSGVIRVYAVLMDVDGRITADEVSRDQLA